MATMRRKTFQARPLLPALVIGLASAAHAQTTEIKPALNVLFEATTNGIGTLGAAPRKDLIITTSPEVDVIVRGVRSNLTAHLRLDNKQYVRNSQTDHTLPSGDVKLHSTLLDQWGGLDASVVTSQVKASILSQPSGSSDGYTTTQVKLSPYLEHQFDARTLLQARITRSVTTSSEVVNDPASQALAPRPNRHLTERSLRLERRPSPLGATLEWNDQETRDAGQAHALWTQSVVKSAAMVALTDEVHAGVLVGRESIEVPLQAKHSDTVRGMRLSLHPNERATLDADVERRFFGTAWKLDVQHRMPFLAWQLQSKIEPSTSTPPIGETPCAPDDLEIQCALKKQQRPTSSVYTLSAKLLQSTFLRFVMMGQRNTLTLSGGLNKTNPLPLPGIAVGSGASDNLTTERYAEALLNRRLTPQTSVSTGVRWSLNSETPTTGDVVRTRNVSVKGAINSKLSPTTTATMGVRHQVTRSSQLNTSDESAMFVGLGYRY